MDISCKFLKQVGPKKQVGWGKKLDGKFANRVGWKKCEFVWAYSFAKLAQNNHPIRLFGTWENSGWLKINNKLSNCKPARVFF